jgi:hypothetical protein
VAQGVDPEFKPQYHKKKRERERVVPSVVQWDMNPLPQKATTAIAA